MGAHESSDLASREIHESVILEVVEHLLPIHGGRGKNESLVCVRSSGAILPALLKIAPIQGINNAALKVFIIIS